MTDETPLPQGGGVLLWGKSLPDNLLFVGPGPTGPDRTQAALLIEVLALDRPDALIETRAAACGTGRNWRTRIDANDESRIAILAILQLRLDLRLVVTKGPQRRF